MYFEGTKNMSLKHDKNTDLSAFVLNEVKQKPNEIIYRNG